MAGSNLEYVRSTGSLRAINRLLGRRSQGRSRMTQGKICLKNGAPASNTADDAPNSEHDICYDYDNDNVYISTSFTDSTTHTWTRIS